MNINSPQMERPQLLLETSQVRFKAKAGAPLPQVGEQLTARISSYNSATQLYTLKSNTLQLQIKSALSFEIGQKLALFVEKSQPVLQLKILSPTISQHTIQQALRNVVAKQQPLDQALNALFQQREKSLQAGANFLPESILKLLQKIQKTLPDARLISTPDGLKKSIQNAGLFFESNLAKELMGDRQLSSTINRDLKAQLLKLAFLIKEQSINPLNNALSTAQNLKKSPSQLITPMMLWSLILKKEDKPTVKESKQSINRVEHQQQLNLLKALSDSNEGALARQQLNQLNNLPTQDDTKPPWNIEIPVINNKEVSLLKLCIQKDETEQAHTHEPSWKITLEFSLPRLGPLRANVHLQGKRLSAHLWSEHSEQITPFLAQLKKRLEKQGLEIDRVNCHQGLPPAPDAAHPRPISGFLDIKV